MLDTKLTTLPELFFFFSQGKGTLTGLHGEKIFGIQQESLGFDGVRDRRAARFERLRSPLLRLRRFDSRRLCSVPNKENGES